MKGAIIKQRLLQTGKSQAELAKILKVEPSTLSSIFTSKDVKTGTIEKISRALNLPLSYFYEDSPMKVINEVNCQVENKAVNKMRETVQLGEKVRLLLKSQGKVFNSLCEYIGMTDTGVRKMFNRDNCNIDVLTKLSEFFEVPVTYFLPEEKTTPNINKYEEEINYLRGKVEAYEKALEVLGVVESSKVVSTPPPHS